MMSCGDDGKNVCKRKPRTPVLGCKIAVKRLQNKVFLLSLTTTLVLRVHLSAVLLETGERI